MRIVNFSPISYAEVSVAAVTKTGNGIIARGIIVTTSPSPCWHFVKPRSSSRCAPFPFTPQSYLGITPNPDGRFMTSRADMGHLDPHVSWRHVPEYIYLVESLDYS